MRAKFDSYVKLVKRTIPFTLPSVLILFGALYIFLTHQVSASSAGLAEYATITEPLQQSQAADSVQALSASLTIADLGIHLDIKQGVFDRSAGKWNIDDHAAYIVTGSATPIIYAHNRPALFSPLRRIEANASMTLRQPDGTTSYYHYLKTRLVTPDDGGVLSEVNQHTVILLTCSGLFDEYRRLVYFEEQS